MARIGINPWALPDSAGVKIFSLSGRVRKPGNYELPFGTTFRQLIYEHGGGVQDGRPVKAIMPAGASSSFIVADDKVLDTQMDYATVRTLGADLGSASVIVIDDTVSIDWIINKTIHFFKHESCGKCTPCREGTYWMMHLIEDFRDGTNRPMRIYCSTLPSKCKTNAFARWVSFPRWQWLQASKDFHRILERRNSIFDTRISVLSETYDQTSHAYD